MTDLEVLTAAAHAVPTVMAARGYEPDCTLGTRLLISALRRFGIPARPVPTSLVIADPAMTAAARQGGQPTGALLQIGQGTGVSLAEGWDGHLIARVRADGAFFIADPTFGQVSRRPEFEAMTGGVPALVHRLAALWPNVEQEVLELPVNGGTIFYRSQPHLTWQSTSGWNHPALDPMTDAVVRQVGGGH